MCEKKPSVAQADLLSRLPMEKEIIIHDMTHQVSKPDTHHQYYSVSGKAKTVIIYYSVVQIMNVQSADILNPSRRNSNTDSQFQQY